MVCINLGSFKVVGPRLTATQHVVQSPFNTGKPRTAGLWLCVPGRKRRKENADNIGWCFTEGVYMVIFCIEVIVSKQCDALIQNKFLFLRMRYSFKDADKGPHINIHLRLLNDAFYVRNSCWYCEGYNIFHIQSIMSTLQSPWDILCHVMGSVESQWFQSWHEPRAYGNVSVCVFMYSCGYFLCVSAEVGPL